MINLATIMEMKLDLSVRNREERRLKGKINKKFQYENPAGDNFELPEKCREKHPKSVKHFKCSEITLADVLAFRKQIYRTIEKRDQEIFLCNYVKIFNPKQLTSSKASRLVTAFYYVPTKAGKVQVCFNTFQAVTAKPETAMRHIRDRLIKKEILYNGDLPGTTRVTKKRSDLIKVEAVQLARKEKFLDLKKGSISSLLNVEPEKTSSEPNFEIKVEPEIMLELPDYPEKISKKSKRKHKKQRIRNQLDLKELECCRICLQNERKLVNIFRKSGEKKQSTADLIEYCLPIQVKPGDGLPQKICKDCVKQIKVACYLKKNCLDSLKIMEEIGGDQKKFKIPGNSKALNAYTVLDSFNSGTNEMGQENKQELEDFEENPENDEEIVENPMESKEFPASSVKLRNEKDSFSTDQEDIEESHDFPMDIPAKKDNSRKVLSDPSMRPRKCYLCNAKFDSTPEDHFSSAHKIMEPSRCTKCEFETDFPWFLNLHYQVHEDDFKLCPFCGKRFESHETQKYSGHKTRCEPEKRKKWLAKVYPCSYCSVEFKTACGRMNHIRSRHTKETPHVCSVCGEKFSLRSGLRRHLLKHGLNASAYCSICNKGFVNITEQKRHEKTCTKTF